MTTNNQYYKTIYETVTGITVAGTHSDNYYLHGIAETLCQKTYSATVCNGRYLKDIAESECETTYSDHHFNNFYLHQWAEELLGEELDNNFDNYFLGVIANNINPTTTLGLSVSPSSAEYLSTITLTATLLDENRDPIAGETITFYEGETSLGTDETDSDGVASITKSNFSVGTHNVYAVWDELNSVSAEISITKKDPYMVLFASSASVNYPQQVELHGDLAVGSGASVKIYDGNTLIDTVTTSGSPASYEISISNASIGTHNYRAVFDGDSTWNGATRDITVTVTKGNPILSMSVPMSLVYSDAFNITATLLDSIYHAIENQPISLLVDDIVDSTINTDSNGKVTFTPSPVSVGNHKFQLAYDGNNLYNSTTSSAVNKVVSKETAVLDVTTPIDNSTYLTTDTIVVEGVLTDNDGEELSGKTISISSTGLDTSVTTGADGSFSKSIPLTDESLIGDLYIVFAGDSNYTSSSVVRRVYITDPVVYDDIEITNTGDCILSYADGDTVTLTAQLMLEQSSASVSGVEVDFYDVTDSDNPVRLNSNILTTDANGQVSFTYTSTGAGDISISATDGSLVSEICVIHDDLFYDSMINSVKNAWSITTGTTISSDSTGTLFSYNNNTRYIKLPVSETSFVMEWDFITGTGNDGFGVETWRGDTWISYGNYSSTYSQYTITGTSGTGKSSSFLTDAHCKLVVNSNGHSLYVNDELIGTVTPKSASGTFYIGFYLSSAITSQKLKNVEIKPL